MFIHTLQNESHALIQALGFEYVGEERVRDTFWLPTYARGVHTVSVSGYRNSIFVYTHVKYRGWCTKEIPMRTAEDIGLFLVIKFKQ